MPRPKKGEERWGKLISFRIPRHVNEVLNSERYTRGLVCEQALEGAPPTCPLCDQTWPKEVEALERVGVRLHEPIGSKMAQFPTAYLRAWLLIGLGYCPLCHQKMKKK